MILSRSIAQGLAVVFTILLARRLGSADFGAYAFIAAIIFVANALTTFGTDMLLIREIAARDDLSGLPLALFAQLVLSLIFIAAVWLFGMWIPNQNSETIFALRIYCLALIPLAFFTVFTTALRGKQFMDAYALLNIIISALQVVAVLILREKNLILLSSFLLSTQIAAALFAGLLCTYFIPRFWHEWRFSFFPLSSFLKATAPIALLTLLGTLYQRLSVTMLSLMTDSTQTGLFSAAARIVEASKTAHIAVFAALYPAMASAASLRAAQRRSNLLVDEGIASPGWVSIRAIGATQPPALLAMTYLTASAILISLILFIFAQPLVSLLYGSEFAVSTTVVRILAWTLVPFTLNTYLTLSFLASNRESIIGRALTASLLGMLILNLWWIPTQGVEGSAWASLVAECLQLFILLASARSHVVVKGEANELSNLP